MVDVPHKLSEMQTHRENILESYQYHLKSEKDHDLAINL